MIKEPRDFVLRCRARACETKLRPVDECMFLDDHVFSGDERHRQVQRRRESKKGVSELHKEGKEKMCLM